MKTFIFTILASVLFCGVASAQVYTRNNLYHQDLYTINPAAVTKDAGYKVALHSNMANLGYDGAPKTMGLLASAPLTENTGVGAKLYRDTRGAFQNNDVLVSYSYMLMFGAAKEHKIRMGLSAGLNWQNFSANEIVASELNDPTLQSDYYKKKRFVNNAGLDYQWKELNVGFAIPYAVQLYNQYLVYATYKYGISGVDNLWASPLVLYQYLPEYEHQVDAGAKVQYHFIWLAMQYRTNGAILSALGVEYKQYKVGYSFEYNNHELSAFSAGTHELLLSFTIDAKSKSKDATYDKDKMPWQN